MGLIDHMGGIDQVMEGSIIRRRFVDPGLPRCRRPPDGPANGGPGHAQKRADLSNRRPLWQPIGKGLIIKKCAIGHEHLSFW